MLPGLFDERSQSIHVLDDILASVPRFHFIDIIYKHGLSFAESTGLVGLIQNTMYAFQNIVSPNYQQHLRIEFRSR